MTEQRIAYSQDPECGWWDTIDKADSSPAGVMLCPHCGARCGFAPSVAIWLAPLEDDQADGILARRGQCDKEAL